MTKRLQAFGHILWIALAVLSPAKAADLGGNCCADLEERVAELEATTAHKDNRKVSLQVYGQVNVSLLDVSADGVDETDIVQDGRDMTFIGFRGVGKISPNVSAGFAIEVSLDQIGFAGDTGRPEPTTRQAYVFVRSEQFGSIKLGKAAQATQDFDRISTSSANVASLPNSLQPLSNAHLGGVDLPFDGGYRNIVRYDSPTIAGFTASASWGSAVTDVDNDGETYDVALRYAGEVTGLKIAAGLGYRSDDDLYIAALKSAIGTGTYETILAAASVKHVTSGLFVSAYYADQDWDVGLKLKSLDLQAGIERKLFSIGETTAFVEYVDTDGEVSGLGSGSAKTYGIGVVQAIDAAATDLYANYRQIDADDLIGDKIDVITLGARLQF